MSFDTLLAELDDDALGAAMHELVADLYPICRSLTGDGVRETLRRLQERVPLTIHEVPTGTHAFDWTVPREWNVRGATLRAPDGSTVVDFANHNLHLVGYSVPTATKLSLAELQPHLHSLPEQPDLVPYRTSYYRESWGFCLPHRRRETLPEGEYEVRIDSSLRDGHLSWGELYLPGSSGRDLLLSCHVCHPSLANDNLSSIAVAVHFARLVAELPRRHGVRILFAPGTLGAIVWLSRNLDGAARRISHGLVLANLGDAGRFHYKRTRSGDRSIDRIVARTLAASGEPHELLDFIPYGYDERQYNSPGIDLPVGRLTRTPWGRYPEYHTSGDDLSLVRPKSLAGSLRLLLGVLQRVESERRYRNLAPCGEPQLGKRGLYRSLGGEVDGKERELAFLWLLNQSDGEHSLEDVSERSGISLANLRRAADDLLQAGLLAEAH